MWLCSSETGACKGVSNVTIGRIVGVTLLQWRGRTMFSALFVCMALMRSLQHIAPPELMFWFASQSMLSVCSNNLYASNKLTSQVSTRALKVILSQVHPDIDASSFQSSHSYTISTFTHQIVRLKFCIATIRSCMQTHSLN